MRPEFSVSLMCMDYLEVKNQLDVLNHRADMYHVDIMDGHFCKNITLSPDFIRAVSRVAELPIDVHLMTEHPNDWLELVAEAGATYIEPHAETINTDAFRVLTRIQELGCKTGVVLNPATPIQAIEQYMSRLDMITIMTVDVGYAGQKFIPEMLHKIAEAKRLRETMGYHYKIQIDGSCNAKTFRYLRDAGADVLILGSSGLFNLDDDLNTAYDKMLDQYQAETKEKMQV